MLIDLHVQSRRTPGCELDPAEVLKRAEALGLDGVAFTDLHTLAPRELHALRGGTKLAVLVGATLETDHGHYLCFFPDPAKAPAPAELLGAPEPGKLPPAREVVEKVRSRGGVAIAAYPYDRTLPKPAGDFLFTLKGLAAVEGWCGRQRANVNELAIEAADHLGVPCVAGSGARRYEELGTAATLFKEPVRTEAELVAALKAGAVWAVAIGEPPSFHGDVAGPRKERFETRDHHHRGDRDRDRGRRERGGPRPEGRPPAAGGERTGGERAGGGEGGRKRKRRRGGRRGGGGGGGA